MSHHTYNNDLPHGAPIDRSQETYEPSPYAPRFTPPSGDVSPDGKRAWPAPTMTAQVLTIGGAAIAVAAVTAGGILAVRKIADAVSGNDKLHRRAEAAADDAREAIYRSRDHHTQAPHFANLGPDERAALQQRARIQDNIDARERADTRQRAASRAPRMSFADEVEHTANRVNNGLFGFVSALGAAVSGFRSVAGQAEGIMREFHATADAIRGFQSEAEARRAQREPIQTKDEQRRHTL